MKIAIIGFAALVIGVGGGAFISGSKVKTQILEAHTDSVALADSIADAYGAGEEHDSEHAADSMTTGPDSTARDNDSTAHGAESTAPDAEASDGSLLLDIGATHGGNDSAPALGDDTAAASAETGTDTVVIEAAAAAPRAETGTDTVVIEAAAAAPRFDEEGAKRLSKIFGAMDARDASKVLKEMSNEEVKVILYQMSDRLAAAILGQFDPERAADLSRVVLRGGGNDS